MMANPIKTTLIKLSNDAVFTDKRSNSSHLTALLCEDFLQTHKWGCKRHWSSVLRRGEVPCKNAFVLSKQSYLQFVGHGRKVWCKIAVSKANLVQDPHHSHYALLTENTKPDHLQSIHCLLKQQIWLLGQNLFPLR